MSFPEAPNASMASARWWSHDPCESVYVDMLMMPSMKGKAVALRSGKLHRGDHVATSTVTESPCGASARPRAPRNLAYAAASPGCTVLLSGSLSMLKPAMPCCDASDTSCSTKGCGSANTSRIHVANCGGYG